MAIPTEEQRLINVDICEDLPDNSHEYLDNYYCNPGYRPNVDEELTTMGDGEVEFIIHSSRCVRILEQEPGAMPRVLQTAKGVGRDRHFFDSNAIDRTFTKTNYYNTFFARSNWDIGGPSVDDKFRAATGLFWVWNEDKTNIVLLNKNPRPITGCLRPDFNPAEGLTATNIGLEEAESGCCKRDTTGALLDPTCEDQEGWKELTYGSGFGDHDENTEYLDSPFLTLVKDRAGDDGKGTADITLYAGGNGGREGFWSSFRNEGTLGAKFQTLVKSTFEIGEWFYDHTFELVAPWREDLMTGTREGRMYYSVKPTYNYYTPKYEHLLNSDIEETILPNLYVLLSDISTNDPGSSTDAQVQKNNYIHHITHSSSKDNLEGSLGELASSFKKKYSWWDLNVRRLPQADSAIYTQFSEDDSKTIVENMKYYNEFVKQNNANKLLDEPDTLTGLKNKFTNILISGEDNENIKTLASYHKNTDAFPMFVGVEFSTPTTQEEHSFTQVLKNTKMSCTLMTYMAKGVFIDNKEYIEFLESTNDDDAGLTDATGSISKKRRSINVQEWYDGLIGDAEMGSERLREQTSPGVWEYSSYSSEDSNCIFLGSLCFSSGGVSLAQSVQNLEDELKSQAKNKMRTFKETMEGKKAETETVMYRIEKVDSNDNAIQNFYLPNSNEIDVHRFVDTQVKYGKVYTYKVYVWILVYGIKYKYTKINETTSLNSALIGTYPEANIRVEYEPSTKLIEVPYFEQTNKVLDTPPLEPNVNIVPYHGVNNKLMINLGSSVGKIEKIPQIIDRSEIGGIIEFLISQNKFSGEVKLEYRTDDFASKYRIYRLDTHPTSYSDFTNGVIRDIDALNADAVSIKETIIPNKKYWYVFRSIDSHEHLSYPSAVYQIEMIDDGSSIYPLIETVEFKNIINTKTSKSLKRFLYIAPNIGHRLLKEEHEGDFLLDGAAKYYNEPEKFKLGIRTEVEGGQDIWGKKFKIRLTSKKTGRKIDVNVKFENKHLKIKP